MKVGVAISTVPGREEQADDAVVNWARNGGGMEIVVLTEDTNREGVAFTKNRGIAALMDQGCDHLFLADDDMYPKCRASWARYVESPREHLMLCWGRSRHLYHDARHSYWKWPRGVLLYMTRDVVERAGGMRTDFRNGHEHVEYSRRVAAILGEPEPFADLAHTPEKWFHAEDMRRRGEGQYQFAQRKKAMSTIKRSRADREHNDELLAQCEGSTEFIEYRRS